MAKKDKKTKPENTSGIKGALNLGLGQISLLRTTVQRYSETLNEMRPWWPVLIPFLLWRGKQAYNKELRKQVMKAQPTKK